MKILYFTADFSEKNQKFAQENGLTTRNAKAYDDVDYLEQCDAVCGDVPKAYAGYPAHELPKAEPKASRTKSE